MSFDAFATSAVEKRRANQKRKKVAEAEKADPLRRRILAALVEGPATTSELARSLEAAAESISRLLKEFREAGLVVSERDEADRRVTHHLLTPAGEAQLNKHVAFGARPAPPPGLTEEESVRVLRAGLERAVRIRRERNRLDEAAAALGDVIREAEKIAANDLALEAKAELAKTLRQNRQPEEQTELSGAYGGLIADLNEIALGNHPDYGADLALPAAAHLKYSLGRAGTRLGSDLPTREAHLTAACSLYGQLMKNSDMPARAAWLSRRAWSTISLAGNLRKQTRLERALNLATVAKRSFDVLEDEYGQAQCLFMFGLCLRLLGEFHEALACLQRADEIAAGHGFERAKADTLMQMGEVKRCLGDFDEARAMLTDALDLAGGMELLVTQGFAQSALGAVEFQVGRMPEAKAFFGDAEALFEGCGHVEGMALNARRQAAVARTIAADASRPSYVGVERLIESAYAGYEGLHSPAGIVACAVEEGRVQMLRSGSGHLPRVVSRLKALLSKRGQREILELDPWVPRLLTSFAEDVEDGDLVDRSREVLLAADETLAERGKHGVERVATVVDEIRPQEESEIELTAAVMGGESRRDPCAFEEDPDEIAVELELHEGPLAA